MATSVRKPSAFSSVAILRLRMRNADESGTLSMAHASRRFKLVDLKSRNLQNHLTFKTIAPDAWARPSLLFEAGVMPPPVSALISTISAIQYLCGSHSSSSVSSSSPSLGALRTHESSTKGHDEAPRRTHMT